MGRVNFFALGGLQENGKNLYVVEADDMIFIIDCGLKYPTSELYGVDIIVNDLTYLIENSEKIQGLFLSHCHDDHIGGVSHLLKDIPNIKIYGSKFTLAVLENKLREENYVLKADQLNVISSKSNLEFGSIAVRFFAVSHNVPESYGIAIKTEDGYLIYTSNYNFDQNSKINYSLMYRMLAMFAKEGVLALFTESLGANNESSRGNILEFKLRITNLISQAKNRLIISLFSSDILRIQQICQIAVEHGKKIALIGVKRQRLVNQALALGKLKIPEENIVNLNYIDEKNLNNDPNLVVLVTGERHEPYFMLQRMSRGIDRLIHIEKNDQIIILTNPYLGTEKMATKTLDMIYRTTSNVVEFSKNLLPTSSANREEIKQMINMLKPKYVVPVIGEYRHQYALRIVANCIGYNDDKLIILDNGDVITFDDGEYVGITKEVPCNEVLIDGKAFKDVGDVVMRDRELLAQDGVILISASINPRTKTVILGPKIVTRGFTYTTEDDEIITKMKEIFFLTSTKFLVSKFVNWSEFKTAIKNEISHYIYKEIKKSPIIIPVLISTDLELIKNN